MHDYRPYLRQRVIVVLADHSLAGELVDIGKSVLVLAEVTMLAEGQPPAPVDGVAIVPGERVVWVQVP